MNNLQELLEAKKAQREAEQAYEYVRTHQLSNAYTRIETLEKALGLLYDCWPQPYDNPGLFPCPSCGAKIDNLVENFAKDKHDDWCLIAKALVLIVKENLP